MIRILVSLLILCLALPAAAAEPIDQAGWNARKQTALLSNGLRMAYVEYGNPDGPPVLLLHGYTDSSRSWTLVAPHLADFRLLIPDQRGHGASDKPRCCYSTGIIADDARLFLDALNVERAAVVGHSLGSMVAQALAAEHPGRVSSLVLVGSTALVPVKRGDWLWTNVAALGEPIDRRSEFLREWNPANAPTPVDASFAAAAMEEILAVPLHVWKGVIRELADIPVARPAADVRQPVLVLSGGKDSLFPAEHHHALLAAYPQALGQVFPDLGHNLIWERPDAVAAPIRSFLAAQP
jgi:pimeloyl-ACP methyl ester carboxylesterase